MTNVTVIYIYVYIYIYIFISWNLTFPLIIYIYNIHISYEDNISNPINLSRGILRCKMQLLRSSIACPWTARSWITVDGSFFLWALYIQEYHGTKMNIGTVLSISRSSLRFDRSLLVSTWKTCCVGRQKTPGTRLIND